MASLPELPVEESAQHESTSASATATFVDTRLLELDGLRGIAILMVLVCHYCLAPGISNAGTLHVFGFRIFSSGVDLFFVLSGFLIGGILLDHRNSSSYFQAFYGRRIFRIFPIYYGFLAATAIVGVILHSHGKPSPVFDAATPYWTFLLFLQNFSLAWFGDWGWITVTMAWSLALEEQFYLTLPLAVKYCNRKLLVGAAIAFVVGAPILRFWFSGEPHSAGALLLAAARVDGLTAGFLCAVLVRRLPVSSKWLAVAAPVLVGLVGASHIADSPIAFLGGTFLLLLYSSILLLAIKGNTPVLRSRFLRFFGTISYTLYMIHQSALVFFHALRHQVPSNAGTGMLVSCVALLASIGIAWISWLYFEKPLLSWARARFRYDSPAGAGVLSRAAASGSV